MSYRDSPPITAKNYVNTRDLSGAQSRCFVKDELLERVRHLGHIKAMTEAITHIHRVLKISDTPTDKLV